MKFLLEIIQSQSRDPSQLIALTTDSREIGLKDEKATIHEFIDTLERITNELRSDPNATAFLSRVRKTDAPDYYDVIKKPMDLGTVLKKVKAGAYKTKSSFNDDLELIWTNCFTYNLDINHHLRAAAESLRKKAQNLLKFVSEPSINPPPLTNGTTKPTCVTTGTTTTTTTTTKELTSASTSQTEKVPLLGLKLAEELWRKTERGRAAISEDELMLQSQHHHISPQNLQTHTFDHNHHNQNHNQNQELLQSDRTTIIPKKNQNELVKLEDRKALIRSPDKMWNWFEEYREKEEEEENLNYEILDADLLMSNLPALPFFPHSIQFKKSRPPKKKKKFNHHHHHSSPPSQDGLKKLISSNIKTLWDIKKVYRKFSNLIGNQPLKTELGLDGVLEEEEALKPLGSEGNKTDDEEENGEPETIGTTEPINFFKKLPPVEIYQTSLANSAAHHAMLQIVAMIVTHVGFDSTHVGALHCLTEIAIQYLSNIGRSLHFFSDRFSPMLSSSEMIYQTLRANGVGLDELESYVKDDVEKYGNKLNDLLRKLHAGYANGLAGSAAKAIDDEDFFARDGEALMTGEFTNELGEDFFGLRDLGLDSELGLSALKIPSRLFHGRPKTDADQASIQKLQNEPEPEARFIKPEEFIKLKPEWIEEQIGILKPIYKLRLETKEFKLKDDDQILKLPKIIRPKVPPSGKIPVKRRALIVPSSSSNVNKSSALSSNKKS